MEPEEVPEQQLWRMEAQERRLPQDFRVSQVETDRLLQLERFQFIPPPTSHPLRVLAAVVVVRQKA